jgi:hypothetical protein
MKTPALTPEQEVRARAGFAARRGPKTYAEDLMGPPPSPEVRAEMEEMLRRDPEFTTEDLDEWLRLKEINDDAAQQYDWLPNEADEELAESEEMRMGRLLHCFEFLKMLREGCHLRCWYGQPGRALASGTAEEEARALGYETVEEMAEAGWAVKERRPVEGAQWIGLSAQDGESAPMLYVCGVQAGWMAEYEVFHRDPHRVRLGTKYRGWRTVLLRLILKGFLEEELAHQVFGRAEGPCSARYNRMLHAWRNRPRQELTPAAAPAEEPPAAEPETEAPGCAECGRKYGNHNVDCSRATRAA